MKMSPKPSFLMSAVLFGLSLGPAQASQLVQTLGCVQTSPTMGPVQISDKLITFKDSAYLIQQTDLSSLESLNSSISLSYATDESNLELEKFAGTAQLKNVEILQQESFEECTTDEKSTVKVNVTSFKGSLTGGPLTSSVELLCTYSRDTLLTGKACQ